MGERELATVWEWMPNGSIAEFIKSHEWDANRFKLVGIYSRCQPQL